MSAFSICFFQRAAEMATGTAANLHNSIDKVIYKVLAVSFEKCVGMAILFARETRNVASEKGARRWFPGTADNFIGLAFTFVKIYTFASAFQQKCLSTFHRKEQRIVRARGFECSIAKEKQVDQLGKRYYCPAQRTHNNFHFCNSFVFVY